MADFPSLQGQLVVITGGAGGIGAAMVEAFAAQRADVRFLDIDANAAARTEQRVVELGFAAPAYGICDLRDVEASRAALERLLGGRDAYALVNNAANDRAQPLGDVTPDDWDDAVAVNLRHQFFLAQAVAPGMRRNRRGAIVNLGSISWMMGATSVPVYATLKSAVAGLTKTLARELGPDGIRVNAIAPGWVLTERQLAKGAANPQKFDDYLQRQCLRRHLAPGDIAQWALWLCADESAMCTGQTLIVDGGVI